MNSGGRPDGRKRRYVVCFAPGCKKRVYRDTEGLFDYSCSAACETARLMSLEKFRAERTGEEPRALAEVLSEEADDCERLAARVQRTMNRIKKNYSDFGDYAECAALLASLQRRTKELRDEPERH